MVVNRPKYDIFKTLKGNFRQYSDYFLNVYSMLTQSFDELLKKLTPHLQKTQTNMSNRLPMFCSIYIGSWTRVLLIVSMSSLATVCTLYTSISLIIIKKYAQKLTLSQVYLFGIKFIQSVDQVRLSSVLQYIEINKSLFFRYTALTP